MISLARFILKGYSQAALVAASMAMLGMLLPPLAWLSGAAVALVTLVNGHRSGLLVTAIAGIATAVLAGLILSVPILAVYYVLLVWLPLVLVAVVLRQTVSLVFCLQLIAAVSILGLILMYVFFPDIGEIWRSQLNMMADDLVARSEGTVDKAQMMQVIDQIVRLLPGFFASSFMIGTVLSLYLARWWQAVLYNPGGFGQEFRAINLGKTAALIALAIAIAAALIKADMFNAMLLVVFALYLNQGVAVLHSVFHARQLNSVWLFLVYLFMFFVPHIVVVLALAGLADTWIDFRRRLSPA
jgi:MFS family permease